MRRTYLCVFAIVAFGGLGLWLNHVLKPETPQESAYRLMGEAGLKHDLDDSDTARLCQLIRSDNPEIVRWALGAAMDLKWASVEEKAAICAAARTVTWEVKDPYDLEYAQERVIRRLSK